MSFDYPSSPVLNQVYTAPTGQGYVWSGTAWNLAQTSPQAPVASDNPPASPYPGQLWMRSTTGALYMWYADPNSSQWIQIPGVFMPGAVAGVTDGSNAAAGMVGEYLTATVSAAGVPWSTWATAVQLPLTAGDWDVWGTAQFTVNSGASMTSVQIIIGNALNSSTGTISAGSTGGITYPAGATAYYSIAPVRYSVSASMTAYINTYIVGTGSGAPCTANIYARRRR